MEFGELLDEASEQAGIKPSSITHEHMSSATRSLNLLAIEIEQEGAKPEYRVDQVVTTMSLGQQAILLPEDTIDVTEVTWSNNDAGNVTQTTLKRSHRQEWTSLYRQDVQGRPASFWVSKSMPTELQFQTGASSITGVGQQNVGQGAVGGLSTAGSYNPQQRLLILYPANGSDGARVTYNRMRWTSMPGNLASDLDFARSWLDTVTVGLAARLAMKFNLERYDILKSEFQSKLARRIQDEDRGPVYIGFRAHGFSRRRRH